MSKSDVPSNLSTPNDLEEQAREEVACVINPLIADCFALYVKTKNFHWHMSGSHFRDYHLLLDEQSDQILDMVDVLAERMRKLGQTTIRSIGQIKQLQSIKDDDERAVPAREMLHRLMLDNKAFIARMRSAHQLCSDKNDVATTSLLENYIDETERRVWFLFETLTE